MKTFLIILAVLLSKVGLGQIDNLNQYYVVDTVIRACNVKKIIKYPDFSVNPIVVEEYDKMGRRYAEYNLNSSLKTCFEYSQRGDTILKLHFNYIANIKQKCTKIEKFLYDSSGKILCYIMANNYERANDSLYCEIKKIKFYHDNNLLKKWEIYYADYSNDSFNLEINPKNSEMIFFCSFEYSSNKNGEYIYCSDANLDYGKFSIDTLVFDRWGRLTKSISFIDFDYTWNSCERQSKIRTIKEIRYSKNKISESNTRTNSQRKRTSDYYTRNLNSCGLEKNHSYYQGKVKKFSITQYEYY